MDKPDCMKLTDRYKKLIDNRYSHKNDKEIILIRQKIETKYIQLLKRRPLGKLIYI